MKEKEKKGKESNKRKEREGKEKERKGRKRKGMFQNAQRGCNLAPAWPCTPTGPIWKSCWGRGAAKLGILGPCLALLKSILAIYHIYMYIYVYMLYIYMYYI